MRPGMIINLGFLEYDIAALLTINYLTALLFNYYPMCWPSPALVDGRQHGTQPNKWPDAATGCPAPNTPFPTYYNIKRCSDNELRIIYSLYYQHDGFSNLLIAKGHEHDWERYFLPPSYPFIRIFC